MTDDELDFIARGGIRQGNFWDSLGFYEAGPLGQSTYMFGNRNVGRMDYCNLQVDGTTTFEGETFVIRRWYMRTNVIEREMADAFAAWAKSSYVTLIMGEMPQWTLPVEELLARRPTAEASEIQPRRLHDPWPLIVPSRQNISARLEVFGGSAYAHDQLTAFFGSSNRVTSGQGRVWVHLEGVMLRGARRAKDLRWAKLLGALVGFENRAITAEEEIASWIRQQRTDTVGDPWNGYLEALADGVLEHRARR